MSDSRSITSVEQTIVDLEQQWPAPIKVQDAGQMGRFLSEGICRLAGGRTPLEPARATGRRSAVITQWSVRYVVLLSDRQLHGSPFPAVGEGGWGDEGEQPMKHLRTCRTDY